MGQVISYSVRDETLHCLLVIRLFHTFLRENPEANPPRLSSDPAKGASGASWDLTAGE
jgi:ribonucleoside-diphosphate reductase beta chain